MPRQRKTTRFSWDKNIILLKGNKKYEGTVQNISLKNALISSATDLPLKKNDKLSFFIPLSNKNLEFQIQGQAFVARKISKNKIAIEISTVDPNSFDHLKKALIINTGNRKIYDSDMCNVFFKFTED
jgi:hypothetical protein